MRKIQTKLLPIFISQTITAAKEKNYDTNNHVLKTNAYGNLSPQASV